MPAIQKLPLLSYTGQLYLLSKRLNNIYKELDKEAKASRKAGEFGGWDWPTLCMVKPAVANEITYIKSKARGIIRALKSAGLY